LEIAGHAPHTKDISFLPTTILLFVISLALPSLWHGSLDRKVSAMAMTVTIATHLWSLTSWMPERICVFQWETEALVLAVSVIFLQQIWDRRKAIRGSKDGFRSIDLRYYVGPQYCVGKIDPVYLLSEIETHLNPLPVYGAGLSTRIATTACDSSLPACGVSPYSVQSTLDVDRKHRDGNAFGCNLGRYDHLAHSGWGYSGKVTVTLTDTG
jgi:hypothetical protein